LKGITAVPIYLYVKTHLKTGLKYLGKTTKSDPHLYPGSGRRWKLHLKKHGYDYDTEILKECQTEEELKFWGIYYSRLWNVVDDPRWANLTEETGTGGRTVENFKHSEETKERIRQARIGKKLSLESKKKISDLRAGVSWGRHAEETKEKIQKSQKGKRLTDEHKANLKAARDRRLLSND
jgi:hypothetical protein